MSRSRRRINFWLLALALWLIGSLLIAAEQRGQVTYQGLPVPGATVTLTQGSTVLAAVTDEQGLYSFSNPPEGDWEIDIAMAGFELVRQHVTVNVTATPAKWELKMLPLDQMQATAAAAAIAQPTPVVPVEEKQQPKTQKTDDQSAERAAEGLLINGSSNNGATSPFAQAAMFGNNRFGGQGLYNGGIGIVLDNSALDAKPYSLTGQEAPKASYNRMTGVLALGGPLRIPHLLKNGPTFFLNYQWTRNNTTSTLPALMPTLAERNGIFSNTIVDPLTGAPFPGNVLPQNRISSQAQALLSYYPQPNLAGNTGYNYQIPVVNPTHQDALQSRFNKSINPKNQIFGRFAFQNARTDNPNVFGFLDTTDVLGIDTDIHWFHRFGHHAFITLGYEYSRLGTRVIPFFENRINISSAAGIVGNNQSPMNWGPPALSFASGIAGLTDSQSSFNRNQTSAVSPSLAWNHGGHNFMFGSDVRREEFNDLGQQNARGAFAFTASGGADFADFLLGVPNTATLAFGNADKYFRESVYDGYVADDWRLRPELTLNLGVRWEYGAPVTELYDRLVNLDILPGFTAAAPVLASDPTGLLTGEKYPASLIRPDKRAFEPRIGIAWRPRSGSSLVVRAGYGVYYDTSVYQTLASQMAQQPPLSKVLSLEQSAASPLTLASGFTLPATGTGNTFAIDPNFRVGYVHNWQVSVQKDLAGSLQMAVSYLGIKGTRGTQEFLPNTYPVGGSSDCTACPIGFAYLTSNGNSTREAGQIQLRRRLHSGLAGTLQYTYSKSIDDDAVLGGQGAVIGAQNGVGLGNPAPSAIGPTGLSIAQNWLDLSAERGLSTFDQRHLLSAQMQYTTGMGLAGGTLANGWKGALLKEWTVMTQISAGSGLPETPIYLAAVEGTGVTGTIRPNYTGAPLYAAPAGSFLNPAAYAVPLAGQWGNAGRDSITGPAQLSLSASLGRTFRLRDRLNLDLRFDATNVLNHVSYTNWNTTVNSSQFGLAAAASAMRSVQTTLRLRF